MHDLNLSRHRPKRWSARRMGRKGAESLLGVHFVPFDFRLVSDNALGHPRQVRINHEEIRVPRRPRYAHITRRNASGGSTGLPPPLVARAGTKKGSQGCWGNESHGMQEVRNVTHSKSRRKTHENERRGTEQHPTRTNTQYIPPKSMNFCGPRHTYYCTKPSQYAHTSGGTTICRTPPACIPLMPCSSPGMTFPWPTTNRHESFALSKSPPFGPLLVSNRFPL